MLIKFDLNSKLLFAPRRCANAHLVVVNGWLVMSTYGLRISRLVDGSRVGHECPEQRLVLEVDVVLLPCPTSVFLVVQVFPALVVLLLLHFGKL